MTPPHAPADRDEYAAAMLRAADRVALAYRSEDPDPAQRRALYAANLLTHTAGIVVAVRDDGPDELRRRIHAALSMPGPSDVDPVEALVTVLAAQIDPCVTHEEMLGWTRGLRSVRVGNPFTDAAREPDLEAVMAGLVPASQVPPAVREEAVARLLERGMGMDEIADRMRVSVRSVLRLRQRRTERQADGDTWGTAPSSGTLRRSA